MTQIILVTIIIRSTLQKIFRKIPKISHRAYIIFSKPIFQGLIFGGAYIWRGLCTEGNLRLKIDWASL